MREAATVQLLAGGRLRLQHGPIDVVLRAWGARTAMADAYEAVAARFRPLLGELVGELPELRKAMGDGPRVEGAVAKRMVAACGRHRVFVTPMAAVAGAVADELLAAMTGAAPLDKAFVNDGGDIALHLTGGETMGVGVAADFSGGPVPAVNGQVLLRFEDGIGGAATSGRQGRSFSLGVADSVTVLARDAAGADAAATLIANAVDLPGHPAIRRTPARALDPDSDLGDRPVTTSVGPLAPEEVAAALAAGRARAEAMRAEGLIRDAALTLRGETVVVGRFAARGGRATWPCAPPGRSGTLA
ncbi:MAG: FIG00845751: hypothetical protein [uncultured Sphingomonas sp.]|uniref:Uncharacterized protein n=1 Tax=uncultured Sphingomonas sp. TaxID=158754 RepID=A0A6J4TBA6_9SPHN|nr:UPF0280 family protein [uncultured Sphingomonas sp.]CAA9518044.1 MAG: FIG00845751: hypothetical protein [uncultured Sphingomonas sp.]